MPLRSLDADQNQEPSGTDAIIGHSMLPAEMVVVVSRSPVNLIVLSRIVERARLRAVNCGPDLARAVIAQHEPLIVILDGGADLHDCDAALEPIAAMKQRSNGTRPHVVLLTTRNMRPDAVQPGDLIDSLVAKPVTPERLQPLIENLRDRSV